MERCAFKGICWYAGDSVYIETRSDKGKIDEIDLVQFIKKNIKENSKVTIIINSEEVN